MSYWPSTSQQKSKPAKIVLKFADNAAPSHCKAVNRLAFLDGRMFTAGRDGAIMEWQAGSEPRFMRQYVGHFHWVNDIVLDSRHGKMYSASSDHSICAWPLDSDDTEVLPLTRWNRHTDYIQTLSATSDFLFSGGQDGHFCRWSLIEERSETVQTFPGMSIWSIGIDASGQLIGLSFVHKVAKIFDLRSEGEIFEIKGHTGFVRTILVDADGRHALTGSSDHQIKLWDLGMRRCIHTFDCHSDSVYSLHASSDFNHV